MGKTKKAYDFAGYVTKYGVKCGDGRVILKDAFKHNDGAKVPLVWQHQHDTPKNVLGHVVLEHRDDGVYGYGKFNDSELAHDAKMLVENGDIEAMSIFANHLTEQSKRVKHGEVREVSLVLAGANPGAIIDNVVIQHGDEFETVLEEACICFPDECEFAHGDIDLQEDDDDEDDDVIEHGDDQTVGEIFDSLNDTQKNAVYVMLAHAAKKGEDDTDENTNINHSDKGGKTFMKKNIFDKDSGASKKEPFLSHDDFVTIMTNAQKCGSFKEAFLEHASVAGTDYGIKDINLLFPDAQTLTPTPEMISRDMAWVDEVLTDIHHSPFSRIKSVAADITADEARARGYVKGTLKKEEVIKLLKRITTPCTVYKKQKLDRDDVIDIADFNVVAWLKMEMRMMLNEELARAALIGDGRQSDSADKISEDNIRPIWTDDDLYSVHKTFEADATVETMIDDIVRGRKSYKGTGNPKLYIDVNTLTDMLLLKDKNGRRIYSTETELASALRVSKIVEVPVFENKTRTLKDNTTKVDLVCIMVNLRDYTFGADKGGEVNFFDDFDLDYNQMKYLLESRCSGCLTKPYSAVVFEKKQATVPEG